MEREAYKSKYKSQKGIPHYFKIVGIIIAISAIGLLIIYKEFLKPAVLSKDLFFDMLIIGLLLFSLANDKIEDERSKQIRLRGMAGAFIMVVFYVIFCPVFHSIFGAPGLAIVTGQETTLQALVFYNIMVFLQKYTDKRLTNENPD